MVNIDRVYQKVLALANKEQRGYITPQEFNLFADYAQNEIFEQYFYDLEQFKRNPSSEIDGLLEQKIQIFKKAFGDIEHGHEISNETHKIDYIYLSNSQTDEREYLERREPGEFIKIKSGSLLNNSLTTPIYYVYGNKIWFHKAAKYGASKYSYHAVFVNKPLKPEWAYVISGENALHNSNNSVDFELHSSEENKLVIKILALAGVTMKDTQLVQVAAGKDASVVQQQKQ